jgi:succinate-semialdehyde dehydrogenase / glutarate-semialdehyde dehydrogenase
MKKGHFELGGNDPFIVLKDADIEKAALLGYKSRMGANAQACINAKRFIVDKSVFGDFKQKLIEVIESQTVVGDPLDPATTLGPLAIDRQKTKLLMQVDQAVK